MDPVQKLWMYENWIKDQQDEAELAKNHAYLLGSFWNPDAVKQLMKEGDHISTDEEFEESTNIVKEFSKTIENIKAENKSSRKRKRKKKLVKG